MARVVLLLLAAASVQGRTTDRVIRFLDEAGAVRTGAYEGGGFASLVEGWEVLDERVRVAELLAPVEKPPYVLGIGLNYWAHINATNMSAPKTPSLFFKGSNGYLAPGGTIEIPEFSSQPDYEGELAVVFKAVVLGVAMADVSQFDALGLQGRDGHGWS